MEHDIYVDMPPNSGKAFIGVPIEESKKYPYLICCGECHKGWDEVKKHMGEHLNDGLYQ